MQEKPIHNKYNGNKNTKIKILIVIRSTHKKNIKIQNIIKQSILKFML